MKEPVRTRAAWHSEEHGLSTVARNVGTRYVVIGVESVLGLVMLPFNLHYLGQAAYGLWMLTASLTAYFSVLDLGYGSALVRFVAHYRAKRDERALNEIVSTLYYMFTAAAIVAYLAIIVASYHLEAFLNITPDQATLSRQILLLIGVNVAMALSFSVFGAVINGFQRYYLNNYVAITSALVSAAANVVVLLSGYGLIELVAATTCVQAVTFFVFRWNAYHVFPKLRISLSSFRRARMKEVTGFSVYTLLIDWAHRLNYSTDPLVIGSFLNPAAVAVYVVGQRVPRVALRLSVQLSYVIFPLIVDRAAASRVDQLRLILLQGTRLSLATVMPIATAVIMLAEPLMHAWVGSRFTDSVLVSQILAWVVIIRVAQSAATTVLKGAGEHKFLARYSIIAAVANVVLSLGLVRFYGLPGVAWATLITVGSTAVLRFLPAACRRVEISIVDAFRQAVWPAVWPAAIMAVLLFLTRQYAPPTLWAVLWQSVAGGLLYAAVFVVLALDGAQRDVYRAKFHDLRRHYFPDRPLREAV